jgi:hypothetical protein
VLVRKILIFVFSLVLLLAACEPGPSLDSQIQMQVTTVPEEVVLNMANNLKQEVEIFYEITNNSEMDFREADYEISLGIGRPNNLDTTLFTFLSQDIMAGVKIQGSHKRLFEQVLGDDGEHEIRLTFSERNGNYTRMIKEVREPMTISYE